MLGPNLLSKLTLDFALFFGGYLSPCSAKSRSLKPGNKIFPNFNLLLGYGMEIIDINKIYHNLSEKVADRRANKRDSQMIL